MSQVSVLKPDFISGCNRCLGSTCSQRKPGPPVVVGSAFTAVFGPCAARHHPPPKPTGTNSVSVHSDGQGTGKGVSCVLIAQMCTIIWSSFRRKMWQAGEPWPLLCTLTAEKGLWFLSSLPIWAGAREERGRERTAAFLLLAEWPWQPRSKRYGPELARGVIPHLSRYHVKPVLLSRARNGFLNLRNNPLYYLLLLSLAVEVVVEQKREKK